MDFACRELGPEGDVPLILLVHLAGDLDNCDPRVADGLAVRWRVITFDNRGVGGSDGSTPDNIEAMARDAVLFIHWASARRRPPSYAYTAARDQMFFRRFGDRDGLLLALLGEAGAEFQEAYASGPPRWDQEELRWADRRRSAAPCSGAS